MSLASDELLSKCLHGKTQNNNEFISNIIWNRYPKPFMLAKRRSMGVASAVISFNDGNGGILDAMKNYGLEVGDCCTDFCVQRDASSIKEMERKSCDSA